MSVCVSLSVAMPCLDQRMQIKHTASETLISAYVPLVRPGPIDLCGSYEAEAEAAAAAMPIPDTSHVSCYLLPR